MVSSKDIKLIYPNFNIISTTSFNVKDLKEGDTLLEAELLGNPGVMRGIYEGVQVCDIRQHDIPVNDPIRGVLIDNQAGRLILGQPDEKDSEVIEGYIIKQEGKPYSLYLRAQDIHIIGSKEKEKERIPRKEFLDSVGMMED
tara:strand:+ start:241 stop:666 length:426 start_codon:yes stop_codon:yes gene_type:complete